MYEGIGGSADILSELAKALQAAKDITKGLVRLLVMGGIALIVLILLIVFLTVR